MIFLELFKNSVGRPSNEILKKRRNFYIFVILLVIVVIGGGYFYLRNVLSNLNFGSTSKNIQSGIKGDVASDIVSTTWDGKITSADSTYILKYSVNMGKPSAAQKKRADFDGNGKVDSTDSRLVSQMALDGLAYGDVNKDKKHDKKDIDICNEFISGKKKPTEEQLKLLDFNGNGKVDVNDRKVLERVTLGYGDVVTDSNNTKSDGKLTKFDAEIVLKIAAGNLKPTAEQKKLADYDKDGKITATDSRKILEYLDEDDNIIRETVTVTFNKNVAKSVAKNSVSCRISTVKGQESCEVRFPTATPQSGYTVVGWNTTRNARTVKVNPNGAIKVSSNTTFYVITRKTNPLKLTLNKADAASIGAPNVTCYLYNTDSSCNVTMPTIVAKTGYLVLGWSKDKNGRTSQIISQNQPISISQDATYYAITNNLKHKVPDEALRKCILKIYNLETYYKKVDLSNEEMKKIKRIDSCEGTVKDASGIQYLPNLERLILSGYKLDKIDISKNTMLTFADLSNNLLTKLDISKNTKLTKLIIDHNKLTTLDVSKNTVLDSLYATSNKLKSIDVSKNTKLTYLSADDNQLENLNIVGAKMLSYLSVGYNKLTSVNVSQNPELKNIFVYNNGLSSIDVSKNPKLVWLKIHNNKITSLDVSKNTNLETLEVQHNKLKKLVVAGARSLKLLDAGSNALESIDVSKNLELETLSVSYNYLTRLDVSKNTKLKTLYYTRNNISKENLILGNNKNIKGVNY